MAVDQRIKDALDEAPMVVLVVQVLLGFQFSVVLQPRFDQLSPVGQLVHLAGVGLLLAAFTLAVAPATFHRMAEHGNDTPRYSTSRPGWSLWRSCHSPLPVTSAVHLGGIPAAQYWSG